MVLNQTTQLARIVIPGICYPTDSSITEIDIVMHGTVNPDMPHQSNVTPPFNYYTVLSTKLTHHPEYYHVGKINTHSTNGEGRMFGFIETTRGGEWTGNIDNLRYIKKCKTQRIVNGTPISDYSPISEMTELETLRIIRNDDSKAPETATTFDISWVKSLKKLKHVSFRGYTRLNDIIPLTDCP